MVLTACARKLQGLWPCLSGVIKSKEGGKKEESLEQEDLCTNEENKKNVSRK
jgi:hypothetical protein